MLVSFCLTLGLPRDPWTTACILLLCYVVNIPGKQKKGKREEPI